MTKRKKGLVAKTIEIFSVSRKPKSEKTQKKTLEDALLSYVDDKKPKSYQSGGFSGLSDALDRIADRPRK